MHITSPDSTAVSEPHFFHMVATPRRSGDLSMMSSWINVKLWKTSSPAAGSSTSGPMRSWYRAYVVRQSFGRIRLPPISIIYRSGS